MSSPMLEGIRITDLTSVIFGSYCTQVLADLGADVYKIEPETGDTARLIGNPAKTPRMGHVHMRLNRGKRSIVWDMKTDHGRKAIRQLLLTTDVFIHNIRPDAIERLGLGYDAVKQIKPDIVYVHCTGFDTRGPYKDLQAYDDIIQAASGAAALLPKVDGNPQPRFIPMAMADKVSGLHAVYAVLAAIIHRLRTGEGQRVEVPMFESVASFNLLEHLGDITHVPPTGPSLYTRQVDPIRQPLKTKDGYIAIAPYLDDRWVRFFHAAGHPEVLDDPRLSNTRSRMQHYGLMYQLLKDFALEKTTEEWLVAMKDANIPAMRVNEIDDLLDDPQLNAVGLFRQRQHPTEGTYVEVRPPVQFSARGYPDVCHPPHIGQDTTDVERELGISSDGN